MGSVSAVSTMNSAIPRFSVFVAKEEDIRTHKVERWDAMHTFVGPLLELLVLPSLLNKLQDL